MAQSRRYFLGHAIGGAVGLGIGGQLGAGSGDAAAGQRRRALVDGFEWTAARTGRYRAIRGTSPALDVEHAIATDGSTVITLGRSNPTTVTLAADTRLVTVDGARGRETFDALDKVGADQRARVRDLLDDGSVRRFRALASGIEHDDTPDDPLSASLVLAGAAIAQCDGERAAVRRIAKRFAGGAARPRVRPAAFVPRRVQLPDCAGNFAISVNNAYVDYELCYARTMNDPWYYMLDYFWDGCQWQLFLTVTGLVLEYMNCLGGLPHP